MVTDSAGLNASQNSYKPFGEVDTTVHNAAVEAETKGFIGERYDSDAGLQYLNARYYDPELGIFVQPDWFEVTQRGVGTNRFSYSFNDPINLSDPSGNYVDLIVEATSISIGYYSLKSNLRNRRYGAAVVDGVTIAADVLLAAVPGVPGGTSAGTAIAREAGGPQTKIVSVGRRTRNTADKFSQETKDALMQAGHYSKERGHKLHHIVEVTDNPAVRRQLENAGISINDVSNGVGLMFHAGRHKKEYSDEIARLLRELEDADDIKAVLSKVREELKAIDDGLDAGTHAVQSYRNRTTNRPDTVREWLASKGIFVSRRGER